MTHYKILTSITEDYYGKQTKHFKDVTFDQLKEIRGIKTLRKQSDTFSYRARIDRPKVFKGLDSSFNPKRGIARKSLAELVEENNIQAYVNAWRSINHLVA